jgi:hypothetical protein
MRRLVTILLAAAALPAIGDTPLQLELSGPGKVPFSLDVLPPSAAFQLQADSAAARRGVYVRPHSSVTCYYIRQLNANLRKPEDKPRFVPLANAETGAEEAPVASGKPDCLPNPVAHQAGAR